MSDVSKIKDRIAKLLAMAKDTSSPQEAAIAAERARKLMDKHQIDHFDIEEAKSEFCTMQATPAKKFPPKWKDILSVAVAKYNDCFAVGIRQENGYTYVEFRGFKEDVEMAVQMFNDLSDSCTAQCKTYMQRQGHGSYYMARVGDAFKKGWAGAVVSRIESMITEREGLTTASGTSLMVVKFDVLAQEFGAPKYTKANFGSRGDSEARKAREMGAVAGRSHQINKQVEA